MAFKNVCLFVTMACTVMLVNTQPTQHNIQKRGRMKLCGRVLVETLAVVCHGIYHGPGMKRNNVYSADTIPNWENSFSESDEFVKPQTALDFFSISNVPRNTRGGIADECCKNSCTLQELISYCGSSSPVHQNAK
ncbi:Bombyxin-related peptide A, partial [Stegodyphus mimosarum]